jgi:hypothetical protein
MRPARAAIPGGRNQRKERHDAADSAKDVDAHLIHGLDGLFEKRPAEKGSVVAAGKQVSVSGFKGAKAALQFPLLLGFFAGFEEGGAGG